jgi:hypothetical protein
MGLRKNSICPLSGGGLSVSFFLSITVWVTPENQLAELALRGSSVLTQDFRGSQMGSVRRPADPPQTACISGLHRLFYTLPETR